MIVARVTNGLMILGLDEENVRLLKKGRPIMKSLGQFGGTDDIVIVYGKTTDDIERQLEEEFGPLPEKSHPHLND